MDNLMKCFAIILGFKGGSQRLMSSSDSNFAPVKLSQLPQNNHYFSKVPQVSGHEDLVKIIIFRAW